MRNRIITNKKPWLAKTIGVFVISLLFVNGVYMQNLKAENKVFKFNEGVEDLNTSVRYNGGDKLLRAYTSQIEWAINNRDLTATEVLDLFAIKSQECNRYDGLCEGLGGGDFGPFQINVLHKEQYYKSLELAKNNQLAELFAYQLDYATGLIRSYEKNFCNEEAFSYVGRERTNENRLKCIAVSYNGHPRYKHSFKEVVWLKRQVISEWIVNNSNFKEYYNL